MEALQTNTDICLLALPMVAVLVMWFFRLDELVSRPRKHAAGSRLLASGPMPGCDRNGHMRFTDPDGTPFGPTPTPTRVQSRAQSRFGKAGKAG